MLRDSWCESVLEVNMKLYRQESCLPTICWNNEKYVYHGCCRNLYSQQPLWTCGQDRSISSNYQKCWQYSWGILKHHFSSRMKCFNPHVIFVYFTLSLISAAPHLHADVSHFYCFFPSCLVTDISWMLLVYVFLFPFEIMLKTSAVVSSDNLLNLGHKWASGF